MTYPLEPPFRAEHIGSLLRPPELLALRAEHAAGRVADDVVRAAEDDAIRQAIELQTTMGLSSVTDGEFRRHAYSDSFTVDVFDGVQISSTRDANWTYSDSAGQETEGRVPIVVDRLTWPGPINVDNYKFIAGTATAGVPKITLPGPCYIHFRSGRDNISRDVYPSLDNFWQDLVDAYAKEIAALYEAGCRYIQLDETSIAKLGDPKIRQGLEKRGDNWATLLEVYTGVINEIVAQTPSDMKLGIHLCRGNKAGSWQAEAGYDDVAAKLFRKLAVKFYFLEFDSPRAGGFEPQRLVDGPQQQRPVGDQLAALVGMLGQHFGQPSDQPAGRLVARPCDHLGVVQHFAAGQFAPPAVFVVELDLEQRGAWSVV